MASRMARSLGTTSERSHMHTPTANDAGGGRNASYDGTTNANGEPHGEGRRTFTSGHVYHAA